MMIDLNEFLLMFLYIVLIILVIILIILGIKLIKTLNKVDNVIEDVNEKMNKVDGVFSIIDKTTDYAALISDKVIGGVSSFITNLLKKKKGNDKDE